MKKVIAAVLICLLTLNIAVSTSYAVSSSLVPDSFSEIKGSSKQDNFNSMMDQGTVTTEGASGSETESVSPARSNFVGKVLATILVLIPRTINWLLSAVVEHTMFTSKSFTVGNLLTNQYDLFGVNFWEKDTGKHADTVNKIRDKVGVWYVSIRNIAIIGMAIIIVYIGIRMAVSIVADERAKYKKMLNGWVIGLLLLIVLHYLMIFGFMLINAFTGIIANTLNATGGIQAEENLMQGVFANIWGGISMDESRSVSHPMYYAVIYIFLTYYNIKFFILYFGRMIRIYYYIIISPLVCMTYSIDRIKDGRSQAFDSWVTELIGEMTLQPIKLAAYAIFISTADQLMDKIPILSILFIAAISHSDKIIKKVLMGKRGAFEQGLGDVKLPTPQ